MKLTMKHLIIIAATLTLSFPIIYILMLLATGNAHIEFNRPMKDKKDEKQLTLMRMNARKDSLSAVQSQTFLALEQEKGEVAAEKKRSEEQQQHMQMEQQELDKTRGDLEQERKKLEKLVDRSDTLEKKRIKQLAKVYGAMRPEEASRILETLDDNLAMEILEAMSDDSKRRTLFGAFRR